MSARQGVESDESCDHMMNLIARESKRVRVQPYETSTASSPENGKVPPHTIRLPTSPSILAALHRVERDCKMMSAWP